MKLISIFSAILIVTILGLEFFTKSGIYFMLDSIFYPIYNFKSFFSQSIYWHLRDFLNIIFGYQIYSKIILLAILILGSFLGYKIGELASNILDLKKNKKVFLIVTSISFILLNPFTYERIVTQIGIILAVFFVGLAVVYLINFLLEQKNNKLYISSLFFGLALTIMPHTAVFVVIIAIITLMFFFKKFSAKNIIISIFIFLFVNSNWLIGAFLLNENKTIDKISTFGEKNLEVFPVEAISPLNNELTNLLLYGFWGEKYHHLLLPTGKWYIAGFIILFIVLIGVYYLYKQNKKLALYLISLGFIFYILSFGLSSDLFSWFNNILYKYIPYYTGMREAQKLTGLLMIVYLIFFLIGFYYLYKKLNNFNDFLFNYYTVSIVIFLVLISWSPNVLFGYNHQLKILDYPPEIFKSKEFLEKKNIKDNIILFPWHSYMACAWTDAKVISNPIPNILKDIDFTRAKNIEIADLYTNNPSKYDKIVSDFLKTKDFNILKNAGIKYIYVQKYCVDYYPNYIFLEKNKNVTRLFKKDYIDIYKIN